MEDEFFSFFLFVVERELTLCKSIHSNFAVLNFGDVTFDNKLTPKCGGGYQKHVHMKLKESLTRATGLPR